jgi:hypothetical protein
LRFPDKHPDLKVLPVDLRLPREPIGIVTLKNRTLSPTARLFIELAREVAKPPGEAKMIDAMSVPGTLSPSRHAARGCLLMRCYGGSDGENRIDRQIINRAMAPSPISTQPDGAIDAQAKKAA